MVLHALRTIQPLFNSKRTDPQYFEAVEALVWIASPGSEMYFDALGFDPDDCRRKIDLPLYAELALTVYHEHKEFMHRMYIAMARYSLMEKQRREGKKVPYLKLVRFAEEALAYTTFVLEEIREDQPNLVLPPAVRAGRLPAILSALSELEESA